MISEKRSSDLHEFIKIFSGLPQENQVIRKKYGWNVYLVKINPFARGV